MSGGFHLHVLEVHTVTKDGRWLVYVSVPVDMLTREQTEKLRTEVAEVLDLETQEPVFNNAVLNGSDDDPQRAWKHLSRAMTLIGECDAVLFAPGYNLYPYFVCSVEFEVAVRAGKRCFYTYRDASGTLQLLDMGHCGGPET